VSTERTEFISIIAMELRSVASPDTVVGEAIQAGDATIVPIVQVSLGFGAGGGTMTAPKGQPEGTAVVGAPGGGGGGVTVTPIAFLVVSGGDVRLLPVKQSAIGGLAAAVPTLVDKVIEKVTKGKDAAKETPAEPTQADAQQPAE
jgi:uncharacterized spore protein YtfJ